LRRLRVRRAVRVGIMKQTLDARQDCSDVVCGRPSVLQDVKAELAVCVHIRVEHAREELDGRRLVGVRFVEGQEELEGTIFEWGLAWKGFFRHFKRLRGIMRTWPEDNCVPKHDILWKWAARDATRWVRLEPLEVTNQAFLAVGGLPDRQISIRIVSTR